MASKGKITEIADIAAIQKQIDTINVGLGTVVKSLETVTANSLKVNESFSNSKGLKDLTEAQKNLSKEQREAEKAAKKLEIQNQKLAEKEKILQDSLNKEAKTISELRLQNKALSEERNKINIQTADGAKKVSELNQRLDENNKKIKDNVSGLEKQKIGIGGYAESIGGLAKKWALMGLGAIGITSITSALTGAIKKNIEMESATQKLSFAVNDNAESLENMLNFAKEMSATSLFGRKDIMDAEQMALSLGRTEEQTKQMVIAAMGLSRVTGADLNTSMMQMNMTFSGTIGRLAKYAPELKNLTEEQLKAGEGVALLSEKMQRFATSGLDTTEGKLNKFSKAFSKLQLSIVTTDGFISKSINGVVDFFTEALNGIQILNEGIYKSMAKTFKNVSDNSLKDSFEQDRKEVDKLYESLKNKGVPATEAHTRATQLLINQYNRLVGFGDGNIENYKKQIAELRKYEEQQKNTSKNVVKLTDEEIENKKESEKKREELNKKRIEDEKKLRDIRVSLIQDETERELQTLFNKYDDDYKANKGNKAIQLALNEKYAQDVEKINKKVADDKKAADDKIKDDAIKNADILWKEYETFTNQQNEIDLKKKEKQEADKLEIDKKAAEKRKEIYAASANAVMDIFNGIVGLQNAAFETDLQKLDDKAKQDEDAKEKELKAAGNNAELKEKINKKYEAKEKEREKERRKIEIEKAKFQKQAAIFGIILDTAKKIIEVFPNPILMAAAGITGAAQLAVAAAQPIPKYKHGRKGGKAELAIVGEAGQEAIRLKSGETYLTPNKETQMFLPDGASVIPNHELMKNLSYKDLPLNVRNEKQSFSELIPFLSNISDTIKGKKETHLNITESGFYTIVKNGSSQTTYVNNKFKS